MRFFRRFSLLAALGAGVWYWRSVYRFRDPVRLPNEAAAGAILAPADGVVSLLRPVKDGRVGGLELAELLGTEQQEGWLLGITAGPLDVHFSYAPTDGQVFSAGQKAAAGRTTLPPSEVLKLWRGQATEVPDALLREQARYAFTLQPESGESVSVGLISLGGSLHGRALTYLAEGESVQRGEKATFWPESSLFLLTLPAGATPQVSVGTRVRGGETVVGITAPTTDS